MAWPGWDPKHSRRRWRRLFGVAAGVARCSNDGWGAGFQDLVPKGQEIAVFELYGGGVAEVADAVVGEDDWLGPGLAVVFAGAEVVAAWCAAVAVAHHQRVVFQPKQMAWEAPDSDGFWDRPGLAAIGRFGLKGLLGIGLVVVADMDDQVAVCGFYAVELVVVVGGVSGTRGDGGKPAPFEAVVFGFDNSDVAGGVWVLLAGVEEAAILQLDDAVGAGYWNFVGGGPGEAAVGGAEHVSTEEAVSLLLGGGAFGGLPGFG